MCSLATRNAPTRIDPMAEFRAPSDSRALSIAVTALLAAIAVASTTFYLSGLEAAASIVLR